MTQNNTPETEKIVQAQDPRTQAAPGQAVNVQGTIEQAANEQGTTEQAANEQGTTEQVANEQVTSEIASSGKVTSDPAKTEPAPSGEEGTVPSPDESAKDLEADKAASETPAAPVVVPKLPEKDLKEKINLLRQKLEQNERELKTIFRDISFHNQGGQELKAKRDGLHGRIKELSPKAQEIRKRRDETNAKIAELKIMRDSLRGKGKEFSEKIGDLKKTRDDLNLTARGRVETLDKAYADEVNIFLTADIPLEHEINVYNRIIELGNRLKATKKANVVHSEITVEYTRAKEIYTDMDSLHAQIQVLADESQKYHEGMIALYNEIDTLRKEADSYHRELTEKYKGINPLKKKIGALKAESPKLRAELEAYLEHMKEYQLVKDAHKNEGKRELAKEKFKKSGRLSLDEFRLLVENEDIKL